MSYDNKKSCIKREQKNKETEKTIEGIKTGSGYD